MLEIRGFLEAVGIGTDPVPRFADGLQVQRGGGAQRDEPQ
jgi:hypothetical protein